jgi:CubicO group peptidase (beta-lactamase class C family)
MCRARRAAVRARPGAWRPRLLAVLGLLAAGGAAAQAPSAPPGAERRGPVDPRELEAFLDGVMAAHLADKHVAGATVAVVRDGAVLLTKGYGWADVAGRRPVDPTRTLFRIGSISKLFTWTAVMQLVEEGRLDLQADINTWLDFRIPDTYPEPITLWHLLTHTPGLEEDGRDLFTDDPARLEPMGVWLPAHMPKRVRPPGVFSSYSNWGTAVAGYIVERVSGMPFDDYLEQRILGPLGMTQATARQPLPDALAADMSGGYGWEGGAYVPKPFENITGAAPAGSMSASAAAMARWMLAQLNEGELEGARILAPATLARMHARAFTHDPRLPGFGLGFYEKSSHGLRIIGHGGDTRWFHSDMALIPEERLGVFVSYNTGTGGQLSFGPFLAAFLDHYYPAPPPAGVREGNLARFAGTYLFNRMSYTTFQKAMGLAAPLPVRVAPDTTLILASPFGEIRLVQVDSLLFEDVTGGWRVAFRADPSGAITHGFVSAAPMMAMERWDGLRSPMLHRALLAGGLLVFAGFLVAAVARWLRRRRGDAAPDPAPLAAGRRAMGFAALAFVLFVVALVAVASNQEALLSDSPTGLRLALVLPVLGLLLVAVAAWHTIRTWRQAAGSRWDRLRLTATVVAGLVFAWSLHTWNLLGWRM